MESEYYFSKFFFLNKCKITSTYFNTFEDSIQTEVKVSLGKIQLSVKNLQIILDNAIQIGKLCKFYIDLCISMKQAR